METHVLCLVMLACACLVLATPASPRRHDLQHIVSLINNMRDLNRITGSLPTLNKLATSSDAAKVSDFQELSDSELTGNVEDDESLAKGFLGKPTGALNKRQGAWSYDYGLGGGRFGKRNYGDYGIGGGRFGRDVDHVDLSDPNEADLSS
uniref:Cholecystokinin/sulfakinin-1 n=1 Tax=Ambigolimax valentianus TaxID=1338344 RepID=A0A2Z6C5J6_9EUPU|nr:cholecystokinin/sulfakinin-1 [Ambigolimax valentianus]